MDNEYYVVINEEKETGKIVSSPSWEDTKRGNVWAVAQTEDEARVLLEHALMGLSVGKKWR